MKWPSFILGYHGCDREIGEAILAGQADLRPSTNLYDWLGTGIYFWENNPARALEWAKMAAQHGKRTAKAVHEPFVIGAVIDPGNCLDLLEADSIRLVEKAHQRMSEQMLAERTHLPVNRKAGGEYPLRYLDCAVVNYLHQDIKEAGLPCFDSVRAAFVEGVPIYQGAGFHRHTHTQICVRAAASVIGCFRVKSEG